jgi:hypothetical protein
MALRTLIWSATGGDPSSRPYSEASARALLETAARRVLAAEGELREANKNLDELVVLCRGHHQGGLVDEALRALNDRRLH